MAVTIDQGNTGTIALVFKKGGVVTSAPSSGGTLAIGNKNIVPTATLAADQKTVKFTTGTPGATNIVYTGPTGSGITATETVTVVATEADEVEFDDTSFTEAQTPPA